MVTKDVPDHAIVAGNPARVIGDVRERAAGGAHANRLRNAAPVEVLKAGGREMIRVGIVGYGYWGPNLARATAETDCGRRRR